MDAQPRVSPLTNRKVVRRGLLAGLAGLGAAAMLKVTGAGRAEAVDGQFILIGDEAQTAQTETRLTANPAFDGIVLQVLNGGPSLTGVYRSAIAGSGGGTKAGVTGLSQSSVGVYGESSTYHAVEGVSGSHLGVRGISASSSQAGIQGENSNGAAPGVRGVGYNNGTGVKGVSNSVGGAAPDGNGAGIGVHGKSGSGAGVKGESTSQPGVEGISLSSLGVRGISTDFVGVVGISTNNHGLYGFSGSPNGVALVGDNGGGGLAGIFNGSVQVFGSFQVFGAKNAVIRMPDGSNASVYCQESPEPYFEDFGRAQLAGGVANVALEREFATLVGGGDYMVFLTPEGPSGGLYISRRGPQGFEVRDPGNGSVSFTYRIVTRRKDIEGRRFARVSDEGAKSVAAARAALGTSGTPPPGGPGGNVTPPGPFVPPSNPVAPGPTDPGGPRGDGGPGRDGPR